MASEQSVEHGWVARSAATVRDRGQEAAGGLIVAGVVLLSIVVRYSLALEQTAPWIMGDELRYSDMAKSFLDGGSLQFREQEIGFATAYPVLIAAAWLSPSIADAYEIAKAINVVLMTLSAVVVFIWMRRLAPTRYALVASGLVLLMPTFVYTGTLMMENAALPAFLLAGYTISRALERPSLGWQLAVFAAIAVAATVRVQLVTLAIVYPTAIVLSALFAQRAGAQGFLASLRRFTPSFAIFVVGAMGYVAFKLLTGAALASGLGAYSVVVELEYDADAVSRWFVWHAGEIALSVGFVPAVAFGVLLAVAIRRGSLPTAAERGFVAVAAATTFWFVLQAAAVASRLTERIEERYMVYAAPLLLMALMVWLARALPRSVISTVVAAVVPAALIMTIPFDRVFNDSIYADSFGLIPFFRLDFHLSGGASQVKLLLAVALAVGASACVLLSVRLARVLFPAAVAVFLILSTISVHRAIEVQSTAAHAASQVSDPSWIDHTLGRSAEVGFIFSTGLSTNPHLLWQTEFWNRSVRGIYALGENERIWTIGGPEVMLDSSGRLRPKPGYVNATIDEPYVLADPRLGIVGEVVEQPGPLALIRVKPPVRIASNVDGVFNDGWSGSDAGLSQFDPLPGGSRRIRVRVSREAWGGPDVPGRVRLSVGPLRMTDAGPRLARATATREWIVHSTQARTFVLPVPPAPFRVEVRVAPTFSPAQFGQPDARQLGVQLAFRPE